VKFQYLKSSLKKKAEEMVKEVGFKNDGYNIAKQIFIEEYNQSEVIALNTIQTFLKGNSPINYACEAIRSAGNMF
jgi:Protein of unknown function (DUF1759)